MKNSDRQTMTSRQFADALGVSESSVKRWVDDGVIEAMKTTGGHRRIPIAAAVGFIRSHRLIPENPHLLALALTPALGDVSADAADHLYKATLRSDAAQIRSIISGRYLAGADIAAIADGLIRPVLERVGELWRNDPEGIIIEHRAVDSCMQALSELAGWIPPLPADAPVALTVAGPGDPYLLPPMLASLALRQRGIAAHNLGPLTPLDSIPLAMNRFQASLCCISISVPIEPRRAGDWTTLADSLAESNHTIVAGGRCIDSIPRHLRDRVQICNSMTELVAYASGLFKAAPRGRKKQGKRVARKKA